MLPCIERHLFAAKLEQFHKRDNSQEQDCAQAGQQI